MVAPLEKSRGVELKSELVKISQTPTLLHGQGKGLVLDGKWLFCGLPSCKDVECLNSDEKIILIVIMTIKSNNSNNKDYYHYYYYFIIIISLF